MVSCAFGEWASGIVHSVETFRHLIEEVNRSTVEKQTAGKGWREGDRRVGWIDTLLIIMASL